MELDAGFVGSLVFAFFIIIITKEGVRPRRMSSSSSPASSSAPAAEGELLLPPFFPRVPKECAGVAKSFFDALTADSVYAGSGAVSARENGS